MSERLGKIRELIQAGLLSNDHRAPVEPIIMKRISHETSRRIENYCSCTCFDFLR